MKVLGISAFYHDSAICYIEDNKVIACLQEERFSRIKHDDNFPINVLNVLINRYNLKTEEIDYIAFYDKPVIKFERIIQNLIAVSPKGFRFAFEAIPLWLNKKLFISEIIKKHIKGKYKILYLPHHISHAASAFIPSDFQEAAFMINDGVGDWESTSYGICNNKNIEFLYSIDYPHSLGLLYSAFTYFCGFRVNSGEYKLMGLAPYGEEKYVDLILDSIIEIKEDGSYKLNMEYFDFQFGKKMCSRKMEDLFKLKIRKPAEELKTEYADIAASIQKVIEIALIRMAKHIHKTTNMKNLVMAGGVALNCVANSKIIKESGFEKVFIQPASSDAGGALGAALYVLKYMEKINIANPQQYSYLGTEYNNNEIEEVLKKYNAKYEYTENPDIIGAEYIADNKIVGWFQGRMEYGPRALGSRSILGNPGNKEMQKKMNLKIKFRESFRPFAPSVLEEKHNEYFEEDFYTPYMLTISTLRKEFRKTDKHITHDFNVLSKGIASIPAVIHADFSSRIQTVNEKQNPLYYNLIKHFYKLTNIPMIINTSFNIRGQPIVESPYDAFLTFINTDMDILIIGNFLLKKEDQIVQKGELKFEKIILD